jgi:hypothetical protein
MTSFLVLSYEAFATILIPTRTSDDSVMLPLMRKNFLGLYPPTQVDKTPTALDAINVGLLHLPVSYDAVLSKLFYPNAGSLGENDQTWGACWFYPQDCQLTPLFPGR